MTKQRTLAIVGHPNVGKSVIFHSLTGTYVTVSNFPGTTVDVSRGVGSINKEEWLVYDTPGVASLQPRTDDERVTRDLLVEAEPDVILQVADAKNLGKALHLFLQISEFQRPTVLALNMSDERQDRGLSIDVERLAKLLGVPVIETTAITEDGLADLKTALASARIPQILPRYDSQLSKFLSQIESHFPESFKSRRAVAVSLFGGDKSALTTSAKRIKEGELGKLEQSIQTATKSFIRPPEMLLFEAKQHVTQEILGEVLSVTKEKKNSWLGALGNWCMRPFPGYLLAGLTLYMMYQFVGVFGAGYLVGLMEETLFGNYLNPAIIKGINTFLPVPLLQEILIGEYGIVTMALTYAFALILPIVTTFFLFFSFLEDSGYLPRLAVMMDRAFRKIGLNGKAVLPLVLGLGCDTMATVTTRILDTRREKIIASLLLTLAVPCSAQLGAILGMAAGQSPKVLFIWLGVVVGTMVSVGWAAAKVLPGSRSPFLMEIPPLRIPKLSNIFKKVKARLKWYTKEVIPLFILATFVLFVLDKIRLLAWLTDITSPLVVSFLGLPAKASEAFLIGFFRRDYGAAGFFMMAQDGLLSTHQIAVSMVVITLFMPCVAHLLMTLKERGWKATTLITLFTFGFALAVGGLTHKILTLIPFL